MSDEKHEAIAVIERGEVPERMHPMVAAMMQSNPDPDTLRDLLAVQREHEAGEARKAYTRGLVDLKRDLPTVIARDKLVKFSNVRYTHTSLAAVMDAVTQPLTQHGFSLSWSPTTEGGLVKVTCRLTHALGHSEETTLSAPPDQSGSKSPAQGIASTITLLQRYSALSLLGIATADMPEPAGESDPERVDSASNLRALKAAVDAGKSKEDVEAKIGKPVQEWTTADRDTLRAWLMPSIVDAVIAKVKSAPDRDAVKKIYREAEGMSLSKADLERVVAACKEKTAAPPAAEPEQPEIDFETGEPLTPERELEEAKTEQLKRQGLSRCEGARRGTPRAIPPGWPGRELTAGDVAKAHDRTEEEWKDHDLVETGEPLTAERQAELQAAEDAGKAAAAAVDMPPMKDGELF